MSADERRRDEGGEEGGPGSAYFVFVQMEELLDKLKLLNYEATYCKQLGFKPFSRYVCNCFDIEERFLYVLVAYIYLT